MAVSYRPRIRELLDQAYCRMIARHIDPNFTIGENVCEYGNFYVAVIEKGFSSGYLYPDMTIRGLCNLDLNYHGYYPNQESAQAVIDEFQTKYRELSMCHVASNDSQLKGILDNALLDVINEGEMFTAYDVTRKIRQEQQVAGIHVFHSVVKDYVHNQFESGGVFAANGVWDRVTIPIANPNPWLYFLPRIHNPTQYTGYHQGGVNVVGVVPPQTKSKTQPQSKPQPQARVVMATFGGIRSDAGM